MKRKIFTTFCLLCVTIVGYSQDYYWYKGKQIPLTRSNQCYIIYIEDDAKDTNSLSIIEGGSLVNSKKDKLKWGIVEQNADLELYKPQYQTPSFLCFGSTQDMFVTHRFYVKLKQADDIRVLQNYVNLYHAEMEEGALPLWYIIQCGLNSNYNALELANIFYESNLFSCAEPEFIHSVVKNCVNDPKFMYQWNLKNVGQYGYTYTGTDIKYCDAHSITTGNDSIIIGVFDWGVDLSHPDLNLSSISYNAHTQSMPSQIYGPHGTACAGIISAKTNNNTGVAGIAPDCPIMSISMADNTVGNNIANGFQFAADHGCSVISCSWSCAYSAILDDAISYALENGRNGKGCVIVFSAGNINSGTIDYPANSNPDIIAVGAISPDGKRKMPQAFDHLSWGSNYGDQLDIMAPGMFITTTDISGTNGYDPTNYVSGFYGTSAACPHVAAVAGLILSINPNLTQQEVAQIIESTAQKVGGYSYTSNSNHTNGTWNSQMGYGLLNAYMAVFASQCGAIEGPQYLADSTWYYIHNIPSNMTKTWNISNKYQLPNMYVLASEQGRDSMYIAFRYALDPHPSIPPGIINSIGDNDDPNLLPIVIPQLGYLSVTLTQGNSSYTIKKTIREPESNNPSSMPRLHLATQTEDAVINVQMPEGLDKSLAKNAYSLELWHSIYGRMWTQTVHNSNEQIPVANLLQGVYVLVLKENENIIAQTKVLIK